MNDYERIARIIRYLDVRHGEQPSLDTLAAEAGLSPSHFHRLFAAWAGVTPKDFLQCLTLSHARSLLRQGQSVLDAAMEAGLSGPGRLHDLTVSLEAATPGEIKSGGAGWVVAAGVADSPFGDCLIAESPRGICHLAFLSAGQRPDGAWEELRQQWPAAQWRRDDALARERSAHIFARQGEYGRSRRAPGLRLLVRGSTFQVRVWQALLRIPEGAVVSYGALAAALGQPAAARAVGSAVARNGIAYLIPCHRVIRETGVIGDYRWGHERKRALLAWEGARRASPVALPAAGVPSS